MKRCLFLPLLIIVASTAIFRLLVLYLFSPDLAGIATYPDEVNYYLPAAHMIRESAKSFFFSERSLWNGPLNPLWLALWSENVECSKIANVVTFSLASGLLASAVGFRFGWRQGLGIALGLLAYPPTYAFIPTLLTEPLYLSLLMSSLAVLILANTSVAAVSLAGVLLGFATLTRPTSQLLVPLLIAIGVVIRRSSWAKYLIIHGACAAAVCLPTLVWNFTHFGKMSIANGVGAVLYLGNDLRRRGDEPVYSGVDFDTFRITAPYTHLDTEGDRRLSQVAKERMIKHPVETARLFLEKVFRYFFGSHDGYFWPYNGLIDKVSRSPDRPTKLVAFVWPLVHMLVACCGLVAFRSREVPFFLKLYIGAFVSYFTLLHAMTFPIPRMVLPLYPYLLVLAVLGAFDRTLGLRSRLFAATATVVFLCAVAAPQESNLSAEVSSDYVGVFDQQIVGARVESHDMKGDVVAGSDPFVVFNFAPVPLNRNQIISFSLAAHCPGDAIRVGDGQVFWASGEGGFEEKRSVFVRLRSTSGIRVVRPALSPFWQGPLNKLRIDLPSEFVDCEVTISDVQVLE